MPFLTGFYPGDCNIPGIRWLERGKFSGIIPFCRSYVGPGNFFINRDLSPKVKTLFEWIPSSYSIFNPINRGTTSAQRSISLSRAFYALYGRVTDQWGWVDERIFQSLLSIIPTTPKFIFAAFPGIDELSHRFGPHHPEVAALYVRIDEWFGELMKRVEHWIGLERTAFIISSDHGLTRTESHLSLEDVIEDGGFRCLSYPKIFKQKWDVGVMHSGNAMAHLYIRQGCKKITDLLLERSEIDWIARKKENGSIEISSRGGEGTLIQQEHHYSYCSSGQDPLGMDGFEGDDRTSLQVTFHGQYPDALVQLSQVFGSIRSGDTIVVAREGFDLRDKYEWPEHQASHGSLGRKHMMVPLLTNVPMDLFHVRTVDIFPTILSILGHRYTEKIRGRSLIASQPKGGMI